MQKILNKVMLLVFALTLVGCGIKGKIELPDEPDEIVDPN
jgi:predicted small lipoprotein YifL